MYSFNQYMFSFPILLFVAIFSDAQLCFAQSVTITKVPTVGDARQALQDRIKEQSDGHVKLTAWEGDSAPIQYESDGVKEYVQVYSAEIEFDHPCLWESRSTNKSVTFYISKPQATEPISSGLIDISKSGEKFTINGTISFGENQNRWHAVDFRLAKPPESTADIQDRQCMYNIKQIELDYVNWAQRHNGKFPFNVSTNEGGSKELCSRGKDGFEQNAAVQFQFLANGLIGYDYGTFNPRIFICPAKGEPSSADSQQHFQSTNVSYQLFCCTNNIEDSPPGILIHCPIHGWTAYTDGSVQKDDKK